MRKAKGMLPFCAILWLAGHHAHLHGEINRYLPYDIPEGVTERDFAVSYITGKEGNGKDWGEMSEEERILFRRKEDRFNGLPPNVLFPAYREVLSANRDKPEIVSQIAAQLSRHISMGNNDLFPFYCEVLAANMDNPGAVKHITEAFFSLDGDDLASPGHQEALRLTREVVSQNRGASLSALWYLAFKGDGGDVALIEKAGDPVLAMGWQKLADVLRARAEGNYVADRLQGELSVYPSVANTGPQGVYAYHLLRKAGRLAETTLEDGTLRTHPKLPEDLLKMVITFDADGNPVSSVDLAKHGLSMPVITPKPEPGKGFTVGVAAYGGDGRYTVTFPHEQGEGWTPPPPVKPEAPATADAARQPAREEAAPPPPEYPAAPPSAKPLLWLAALALAALVGAVIWKRKR